MTTAPDDPEYRRLKAKPLKLPDSDVPYHPAKAEVSAIQKLAHGEANPEQQKLALECIIARISGAHDWQFSRDQRLTDVALGRSFVGQQILGILKINLIAFIEKEKRNAKRT